MTDLPMIATVAQVAAWLGWTESALRNRLHRGEGHPPFVRQGRSIEFRRDDVLAWYQTLPTVQPTQKTKVARRRASAPKAAQWPHLNRPLPFLTARVEPQAGHSISRQLPTMPAARAATRAGRTRSAM